MVNHLSPTAHYVTPRPTLAAGDPEPSSKEMKERVDGTSPPTAAFIEAQRHPGAHDAIDLEMLETHGLPVGGIENYSRYLTGRNAR